MAASSRSRLDEWSLTGPGMTFSDQELICAHKGKNSAFGRSIVRSGRAEWDIELNFQTFGGITVGVFKTQSSATGNDDDPDYVASLPLEGAFTDSETGYGYTNRTGKFISGGSSVEYGDAWENGDVITIRLDMTSQTLSFSKNGSDQGSAPTPIKRGAYRLAAKMQFDEQKITVKRFWTSLMDEGTSAENEVLDMIHGAEDEERAKAEAMKAMLEETKDDGGEDDSYDNMPYQPEETVDGAEEQDDRTQSVELENGEETLPNLDRRYSLDDLRNDLINQHQRRSVTDIEVPPETETPVSADAKYTPTRPIPEQIIVKKSEESTDVFMVSGKNLTRSKQTVTCVRGGDNEHSAFGAQVVTRGTMEWDLHIEAGRGVIVGIAANTLGWESNFTDFVGSYGYGDDGYKYSEGNIEDYSESFVPGDHVIIRLDMDDRTLSFSREPADPNQPATECGVAFGDLPLDYDSNRRSSLELRQARVENGVIEPQSDDERIEDGAITGYQLAVCMKHRNSKISIESSTQSHAQQYSPRPTDQAMTFPTEGPKQRKLSRTMQSLRGQRAEEALMPGTPSSSTSSNPPPLATDLSDEDEQTVTVHVPEEKEVSENGYTDEDGGDVKEPVSDGSPTRSPRKENGKNQPRRGKSQTDVKDGRGKRNQRNRNGTTPTKGRGKARGGRGSNGAGRGRRDRDGALAGRGRDQSLPRTEPRKTGRSPSNKRLGERRGKQGQRQRATDQRSPRQQRSPRPSPRRRPVRPGPSMDDNDEELGPVRFVKTAITDDRWFKSGPKIRLERATASCRQDAPNGQSAFGYLVIESGRVKWDVRMDTGENFAIGISSSTEAIRKRFPQTTTGYGYYSGDGGVMHEGKYQEYGESYRAGDTVSIKLDAVHHTLSFSKNGADQGIAFRNIPAGPYRLAVMIYNRRHTVSIKRATVWDAQYS